MGLNVWESLYENESLLKKAVRGGAWVTQLVESVRLLISAQVPISGSWDWAPHWALHQVWSLLEILSPSPSAPPPLSLSKKEVRICYGLNICVYHCPCPPNSYIKILTPNVMLLVSGAFGKWLGHEGRALMFGIRALTEETKENSFVLSMIWGHMRRQLSLNQEADSHQTPKLAMSWYRCPSFQNCEK